MKAGVVSEKTWLLHINRWQPVVLEKIGVIPCRMGLFQNPAGFDRL
jgi:hypothetical protein